MGIEELKKTCYYCRHEIPENVIIKLSIFGKCYNFDSVICLKSHVEDIEEYENAQKLF